MIPPGTGSIVVQAESENSGAGPCGHLLVAFFQLWCPILQSRNLFPRHPLVFRWRNKVLESFVQLAADRCCTLGYIDVANANWHFHPRVDHHQHGAHFVRRRQAAESGFAAASSVVHALDYKAVAWQHGDFFGQ